MVSRCLALCKCGQLLGRNRLIEERESREKERVRKELNAIRAKEKQLSQILRARLQTFEEVQNRSHELQNVRDRMVYSKADYTQYTNTNHILEQKLMPLRSDHESLVATITAQE